MNYLKLKQKIYEAIERNPLDRSAYEEMFAVCREYEKIDFQTAHAWNHELRNRISWGLRMTVCSQKFDEAREFDDLMFRSLLFGAQHFFDDYLQAVEYGKPLDKKFYQPRRHYLRRYVDAYQEILDGKLDFLSISMPKRAGKSQLGINFTNMLSGKYPDRAILGVKYVVDENGVVHYSCYSDHEYFEIVESKVVSYDTHILGEIPIIEYPLNMARIGAFELVIPLLDAINLTDSNRLDGVEQFIQALMLFHNVDISSEDFDELRERGAIKFKDIDPQLKAEINYLVSNLNQGETQTLVDHMYQTVLTICGMPNRNGGSSTSDTGSAVIMRDGWSAAEARAKDSELMFKKSERIFLKVVLNICRTLADMDLKVCNVEIRFTRRNYENILQKAQVLDLMLKNNKIHPRLAFEHCGLFVDSDLAYTLSAEYAEEQEQKAQELFEQQQRMKQEGNDDDSGNNEGNGGADGKSAETREQSGNTD